MAPDVPKQPPGFFWQGMLIVLPAILLAGVGLFLLRQDRILAEHEATEQAAQIAGALARQLESAILQPKSPLAGGWSIPYVPASSPEIDIVAAYAARTGGGTAFLVERERTWPPMESPLPSPAFLRLDTLSPDQRALWEMAEEAYFRGGERSSAIVALEQFLDSVAEGRSALGRPALIARFRLGSALADVGRTAEAREHLELMASLPTEFLEETGLPIRMHALTRLLEMEAAKPLDGQRAADWLEELCKVAVTNPTPLTPLVLDRAAALEERLIDGGNVSVVEQWRGVYEAHGEAWEVIGGLRRLLTAEEAADPRAALPRWIEREGEEDLFLCAVETAGGVWIVGRPPAAVLEELRREISGHVIPDYFGVTASVAGRPVLDANEDWKVLATAGMGTVEDADIPLVDVGVVLSNAQALYARQRARTLWFGSLIGLSVGAVLIGFGTAYRAFRRQRALSEMKSNFVSSVSHELRAPIASVRLMAEELEEIAPASGNGKAEKVGQYHRFIVQECRRLSHLIDNVLDFSRIEQGRKQFEFEPADIGALVRGTASLMEPYASERGVRVVTGAAPEVEMVAEVDEASMRQVLVNLMDNAIKHSPAGEEVKVTLGRGRWPGSGARMSGEIGKGSEEAGNGLWICVADAGEGIPPEDQERIFERFYRRGSELRRETQGVGLGLAIARHVVQAHGGSIEVESSPGSGSRFIVRLPVLMEPDVSGAAGGERGEKARGEADSEAARSEKG